MVGGLVVAFAVLAGLLVAQSVGRRDPGDTATGDIRQSITERLNEAGRRSGDGDFDRAIELYDEVLADDPGNLEALTYKGWVLTLSGDAGAGLESLLAAATADPTYPDVHAFLAIVLFRNGLVAEADRELERLAALDPPPAIRDLVADLQAQVDAALGDDDHHGPLGRGRVVAALGEPAVVPREAPGRRLLPAELVLQLQAVPQQRLEDVGDHVAVAAEDGIGVRQLADELERPVAGTLRQSLVHLDGHTEVLAERLERLHAARVRARDQPGGATVGEEVPQACRLALAPGRQRAVHVLARPVRPMPGIGVAHEVQPRHGRRVLRPASRGESEERISGSAASAASTSATVVDQPTDRRRLWWASTPIASSTGDGSSDSDEQAEPEWAATPIRSRPSSTACGSTPSTPRHTRWGSRRVRSP